MKRDKGAIPGIVPFLKGKANMKFKCIVPLVVWLIFFCSCQTEHETKDQWQRIDDLFSQWNRNDGPGCALGVVRDGALVYAKGYGMADLQKMQAITIDSIFDIASTSKQFTAMCIAILEEEGKLHVENDVRDYIPELPQYGKTIRIRHLLHHTSGLDDYLKWATPVDTEATILQKLRDKPLTHEVGLKYEYTNTGYLLLGFIVRRVSGKTLRQFADERIFQPLGMTHTFFNDDISANGAILFLAKGYWQSDPGHFIEYMPPFNFVGNAGVNTSVNDLLLWDGNFYHNRLGRGSQALIERMHMVGTLDDGGSLGTNYAWGLVVDSYRGRRMISHGGAFYGYRAQIMRLPDDRISVILLANQAEFTPDPLAFKVIDILLENQ